MGNLTYAVLAFATVAGTLIVSGASTPDPNDRVFFFDAQRSQLTHAFTSSVPGGFRTAVVSWNVSTPNGSAIEVSLSAHVGDRWTRQYVMGMWSHDANSGRRHSV